MQHDENLSTIRKDVDRATGIVLHAGRVLLMFRRNRGKEYYTFPGGGIESGETPGEALRREFLEETSVEIAPKRLLYTVTWDGEAKESVYLCSFISGIPQLAENSVERGVMQHDPEQHYDPLWVSLAEVPHLLLYPLEIRDWFLEDLASDFSGNARAMTLERGTVRQSLT